MITADEIARLKAPFPLDKHIIREGNKQGNRIRWFTYIDRSDVQDRLEEVFPGEWSTVEPHLYVLGKTISATVGITVRGITRYDGGDDETGEGSKGALTNGFRRAAAYGWHIGRYLYDIDTPFLTEDYLLRDEHGNVIKDANGKDKKDWKKRDALEKQVKDMFAGWYKRTYGNRQQPPPPAPAQSNASASNSSAPVMQDVSTMPPPENAKNAQNGQIEPKTGSLAASWTDERMTAVYPAWPVVRDMKIVKALGSWGDAVEALDIYKNRHEQREGLQNIIDDDLLNYSKHTFAEGIVIVCNYREAKYGPDGKNHITDLNKKTGETDDLKESMERAKELSA